MILDGKKLSNEILDNIKNEYDKIGTQKSPCKLVVITIGDDSASKVYVNNKKKACEKVGFKFINKKFSKDTSFEIIYEYIQEMNCQAHGVIIQLPIISNILTKKEIDILTKNSIYKYCDVDGFLKDSPYTPCTPKGILRLLDSIKFEDGSGKIALVIGRSDIVGKPITKLLLNRNYTVIQAHSKTSKERLLRMFSFSDVVISAVGKKDLITEEDAYQYFKDNRHDFYGDFRNKRDRVIIDVGINRSEDGKLCGDLSEEFKQKYSEYYTPVPGGVGPMTVAMLIDNVWESYKKLNNY